MISSDIFGQRFSNFFSVLFSRWNFARPPWHSIFSSFRSFTYRYSVAQVLFSHDTTKRVLLRKRGATETKKQLAGCILQWAVAQFSLMTLRVC